MTQPKGWPLVFWIGTVLGMAALAANAFFGRVDASTLWGMAFGTVATSFLLGCILYAVRRRTMRRGLGRARSWRQFHLWGGGLFFVYVLLHTGFRWPEGGLNLWIFWLSAWVTVTGLAGVVIQIWIPRTMATGLTTEVLYERIPSLVEELSARAAQLASSAPDPVREFYQREMAPVMATPTVRTTALLGIERGLGSRMRRLEFLRRFVDEENRTQLDELAAVYRAKLECDAHLTLQRVLRGWLWLHVPPSIALTALVLLHIVVVFRY